MIGLDLLGATSALPRRTVVGDDASQLYADFTLVQGRVDEELAKIPLANAGQRIVFTRERDTIVQQWNDANAKTPPDPEAALQAAKDMLALYKRIAGSGADKINMPSLKSLLPELPWWVWALVAAGGVGVLGWFVLPILIGRKAR